MSLGNRPYIGTWQLNNRTLVRQVPDAIVYINGYTELASCASCNKKIDLQKYITQVSCDASTDPISSGSISFAIPRHAKELFDRDGNFLLKPGLEVIILFRGYFPMKEYAGRGQDPEEGGFDADNVSVYPYYQCFRGVATEVSHEFSGGFYSGTMSCANLLHMWQNLKVSVNGAAFGKRPANSSVQPHLIGHRFTGANPYSVVYTLTKVGFGAAFGVEFQMAQSTNIAAKNDAGTESLYAHAAEWWEKRWQEASGRLRMYGLNGRIFNAAEQAYLGRWYDTRNNSKGVLATTVKNIREAFKNANSDLNLLGYTEVKEALREYAYDRYSVAAGAYSTNRGKKAASEDVVKMQAFTLDLGKYGSMDMFETEYVSKLDIVNTVCASTGFEFYQDVDGDLVFKPPMYNLDTREDPVFVIKDRDLISIDESYSEPEVTMMKGTGSTFSNLQGHGIDGWAGVGAVFIDYKLVAQFGYREETFTSNYMSSRHSLYLSAINRLDIANIGMRSGTISIPLRPELRPGYPVYVESEDCFYYAKSISHSFSYGGEATTTISWVAKRSKWCPPIKSNPENKLPSIADIRLDAPGEYPSHPLMIYPEDSTSSSPPRMIGFPNVIMALDADKLNYDTIDLDKQTLSAEGFIESALSSGYLERGDDEDTFKLRKANNDVEVIPLTTLQQEWSNVSEAFAEGSVTPDLSTTIGVVLARMAAQSGFLVNDIEDANNLVNYLAIQNSLKSQFSPGSQIAGRYRYYSCSHPSPEHQAPKNITVNQETNILATDDPEDAERPATTEVLQFQDRGDGLGLELIATPTTSIKGVRVKTLSSKAKGGDDREYVNVISSEIKFVVFAPQTLKKKVQVSSVSATDSAKGNFTIVLNVFKEVLSNFIWRDLLASEPSNTYLERIAVYRETLDEAFTIFASTFTDTSSIRNNNKRITNYYKYKLFSQTMAETKKLDKVSIKKLSRGLASRYKNLLSSIMAQGQKELKKDAGKYQTFMVARQLFFNSIFGEETIKEPGSGKSYVFVQDYKDLVYYTPIFPVSDGGGYELVGNLPYGRGITITKYAGLLQSEMIAEGDTPKEKVTETETTIRSQGTNASDMATVEKFLIAYEVTGMDLALTLTIFNDTQKKAILATAGAANDLELADYLETLTSKDFSSQVKIRNSPVTSYYRGQSIFGETAAKNLANIDLDGGVCKCKGADGAFLLQAFNQERVLLFGEEAVADYQRELAIQQEIGWKVTRQAYAGTSTKRSTGLSDALIAATEDPSRLLGNALGEARRAVGNVVEENPEIFNPEEE